MLSAGLARVLLSDGAYKPRFWRCTREGVQQMADKSPDDKHGRVGPLNGPTSPVSPVASDERSRLSRAELQDAAAMERGMDRRPQGRSR